MGGTENNAEYEDAKNEQAFIEGPHQFIGEYNPQRAYH
jgi:transcription elongation GreA/GreB family factor